MALYCIALLPLAELLREAVGSVMQLWYANDAAMMVASSKVADTMIKLFKLRHYFGYHPEPDKSFVICLLVDQVSAKAAFEAVGLDKVQCVHVHRCVGGFVGSTARIGGWI